MARARRAENPARQWPPPWVRQRPITNKPLRRKIEPYKRQAAGRFDVDPEDEHVRPAN